VGSAKEDLGVNEVLSDGNDLLLHLFLSLSPNKSSAELRQDELYFQLSGGDGSGRRRARNLMVV